MAKVVFLQNSFYEKLGFVSISAVLKKNGHVCNLLIEDQNRKLFLNQIKELRPDIIAFSLLLTEQKWAVEIIKEIKKFGIQSLLIAGGPHPTFYPEFLQTVPELDAICIGEGEGAMLDLANAIDKKESIVNIQNLMVRDGDTNTITRNPLRPLINLDEQPLPDYDLYHNIDYFQQKDSFDFVVSRGCPYKCSYCFFHKWNELYGETTPKTCFRLKSVTRCMDEIEHILSRIPIPFVSYVDSTFNLNKQWMLEFLSTYKSTYKIPFTLNLRPNLVDEETIKALADTKLCRVVRMGIETGNEQYRINVLKKNVTNKQIFRAGELLKKYGIKLMTYNMYGLPGETVEHALETIKMNHKLGPAAISSMIFHPYYGLELTKYALENNHLKAENIQKIEEREYKWFRSVMTQPEIKEVTNLCLLSRVEARYPSMIPLLKILSRLPFNKIFKFISLLGLIEMGTVYYNVSVWRLLKQHLFGDKSKMV